MAAATPSKRCETGELLEDQSEKPSSRLQRELQKINQKNKNIETVRQGSALEQMSSVAEEVDELPFADVQPLPVVARGQPQKINDVPEGSIVEKLLEIPKLTLEPGFKNRAPLQKDEQAKDLIQEALKNPICISTEDLLHVSEPVRQELKKLLIKWHLEKKSVLTAAEAEPGEGTPVQEKEVTIRVERLPEATFEVLAEDRDGMQRGSIVVTTC